MADRTVRVRYTATVGDAVSGVARFRRANDDLGRSAETTGRKLDKQSRSSSALLTAVVTLGPALVPIAAGAVGVAAAFGGMGLAGVAAFAGIKQEMKAGTKVGLEYTAAVAGAKSDLRDLARVAATNVLGSFQKSVDKLNGSMPQLRKQIGELATLTGRSGANLFSGAISGLQTFEPLIRDVSVFVSQLTARFAAAMSGPGVVSFAEYIRSVFPQVAQDVEDIVAAAAHLIAALAPLGAGTLSSLSLLSTLISAIPVDVLASVAQTASSVYLGFKAWQTLSGPIGMLTDKLRSVGPLSASAAGGLRALNIAAGGIGIALSALTFIVSHNAEQQRKAQEATDRYADALRASNGVIDESIRQSTAKSIADAGGIEAAAKFGLSLTDLTDAALRVPGAMDRVNAAIDANSDKTARSATTGRGAAVVHNDFAAAADKVSSVIGAENAGLDTGTAKWKAITAATEGANSATSGAATAAQNLANTYGVSAAVYQAAARSQEGIADKAALATLKMQLENDAAGLLKQSLDLLNGKTLDVASAQTTAAGAALSTAKALKESKGNLDLNTEAGVAARQSLEGQVKANQAVAEAIGKATGSRDAEVASLKKSKDAMLKSLASQGLLTDSVRAYIEKIFQIPKDVPPTKLDVEKKAAEAKLAAFQAQVNRLRGTTVRIDTILSYITRGDVGIQAAKNRADTADRLQQANGGIVKAYAAGGMDVANAHVPEVAPPGAWRVFAEPETQGESYIPHANDWRRPRAKAILAETARKFGGSVQWNAAGSLTGLGTGSWASRSSRVDMRGIGAELAFALHGIRMTLLVDGRSVGAIVQGAQIEREQRVVASL